MGRLGSLVGEKAVSSYLKLRGFNVGSTTKIIWRGGKDEAESLLAAIIPDDPDDFYASIVEEDGGVALRIVVESATLGSSRSTVDDILACLAAAESGMRAID